MVKIQPGFFSSPPALHCLASDGRSSQTTELVENIMSFLQQSDLKKHLSTRSGNMPTHHDEAIPTEGSRVVLRDGNLVTLPPPTMEEPQ
jgi:ABC-type thiamine transport system substrate-binding protein